MLPINVVVDEDGDWLHDALQRIEHLDTLVEGRDSDNFNVLQVVVLEELADLFDLVISCRDDHLRGKIGSNAKKRFGVFFRLAESRGHDDCNILWQEPRVAGDLARTESKEGDNVDDKTHVAEGSVNLLADDL